MRILLAGASGVVGRRLIPLLLAGGHSVSGMSRKDSGLAAISQLGAGARRCDALEAEAVKRCVDSVRPDIIICELTELPQAMVPAQLKAIYEANNRVRRQGTGNLLAAALACGVRRFVTQSAAFWYSPYPPGPKDETAPFFTNAPEPIGTAAGVMTEVEGSVTACKGLEGLALRYGLFYGEDTWYCREGHIGQLCRKRMYPLLGRGEGLASFLHLDDAASATLTVMERGKPGEAYNAVDDEPAPQAQWLPAFCAAVGAAAPLSMPLPMARLLLGPAITDWVNTGPGAQNNKLRAGLGWEPKYPSWREGFRSL